MAGKRGAILVTYLLALLHQITGQAVAGTNGELWYQVEEEVTDFYYIGNVVDDARLADDHTADVLQQLRFSFLSTPKGNFMIEEATGHLKTNGRVDRDEICPQADECDVKLDIAVQPLDYFRTIKVVIKILDINDNSPKFPQNEMAWSLMESANPGIAFSIPMATDIDSPVNGIQRYDLTSPSNIFGLKVTAKPGGNVDIKLELKSQLDRETKDGYIVEVAAFDGGTTPKSGYTRVRISVLDANDHSPAFDTELYEVTVAEDTDVQTTIATVHATDNDEGQNAQITYSFSPYTQTSFGNLFGIDGISGDIYISSKLDFENAQEYNLGVVARDMGADPIPAETTVVVSVLDVNDHSPTITVNTITQPGTSVASVSENSEPGTFVAQVLVVDPDNGDNGKINCSLNENAFSLHKKYTSKGEAEYQILTARVLDRERTDRYNLAVLCKDGGLTPLIGIKHLQVNVDDTNDNAPEFARSVYTTAVEENNHIGALILIVNASDADIGQNAQMSYSLSPNVASIFDINSSSGRITAKKSMNREEMDQIRFNAIATDHGTAPRTSTSVVVVTISDVNDEAPKFTQPLYNLAVPENQPFGSEVGAVHAEDADSYLFNSVTYSLAQNQPQSADVFMIDPISGMITTNQELDREAVPVYHITVIASDNGDSPQSNSMTVTIHVNDVNDHDPHFEFPSKTNASVHVSNALQVGAAITKIHAVDEDDDMNSRINYVLESGNEKSTFSMDSDAGIITLKKDLSGITYKVYKLKVVAADQGSPSREAKTTIDIVVNASLAVSSQSVQDKILTGQNFIIVISVACATGVVTVALVIAIILIRRQEAHRKFRKQQALQYLTVQDAHKEIPIKSPGDGVQNTSHSSEDSINGKYDKKKEVSFNMDVSGGGASGVDLLAGQLSCGPATKQSGSRGTRHADGHGAGHGGPCDAEVGDHDSTYSGDGSNADSGRGPSEEGENGFRANGVPPQRSILYSERTIPPTPPRATSPHTQPLSVGSLPKLQAPPPLLPRAQKGQSSRMGPEGRGSHRQSNGRRHGSQRTNNGNHARDHSNTCKVHGVRKNSGASRNPGVMAKGSVGNLSNSSVPSYRDNMNDSFHSNQVHYLDGVCSKDVIV